MMWSCQSTKLASFQSGSQLLVLYTFRSSARKVWKHDMRYSDSVFEVQNIYIYIYQLVILTSMHVTAL